MCISQYLGEGSTVCHSSSWFNKASSGTSSVLLVWYCFVSSPWFDFQVFFPFYSYLEYLLGHISFCFLKYFVPLDSFSAISLTSPVLTSLMPILPLVATVIHLRYQSEYVTSLLKTSCFEVRSKLHNMAIKGLCNIDSGPVHFFNLIP